MIIKLSIKFKQLIKEKLYNLLLQINPISRKKIKSSLISQSHSIEMINNLSRTKWKAKKNIGYQNILVDGMWDNPNYWIRFGLLRSAMGSKDVIEIGLIGKYNRKNVKNIFSKFGIKKLIDFKNNSKVTSTHTQIAGQLIKSTKNSSDILKWKLPYDFPSELFYDAILKRQRKMHVDINDIFFKEHVTEGLANIEASSNIFKNYKIDFVVLSHIIDFSYASIAWLAAINKIPSVVIYGDFGASRFIKILKKEDIFSYPGVPKTREIRKISKSKKNKLIKIGTDYLKNRLNGKTDDIGSIYSYQKRNVNVYKNIIHQKYKWDKKNKIIGLYLSNWYDYPHSFGLKEYDDFYDWITLILNEVKSIKNVNWLVKSHPCDDWYGGTVGKNIKHIINEIGMPHIKLAEKDWNGLSLIKSLDGIVTPHGTIGIEATFLGVPVIASSNCWYKNGLFVPNIKNHKDFISFLRKNNWPKPNKTMINNCKLFAGIFWGFPKWQENFIFDDDSNKEQIYADLPYFLKDNQFPIAKEVNCLRKWLDSDHSYYNIYKMINSNTYKI